MNRLLLNLLGLLTAFLLTGCATAPHRPPPHLKAKQISDVAGKKNVVIEVHHSRKPKRGNPNQTEGVYVGLAPKGTAVTKGKTDGFLSPPRRIPLRTTGLSDTSSAAAATQPGDEEVYPDLLINNGWLYVTGDVPCIGSNIILVEAEGCRVLLECLSDRQRVLFLEGSTTQIIHVSQRPYFSGDPSDKQLQNGKFVDAFIVNGVFDHWSAVQTITQQMLDDINATIDPYRNEDGQP